MMTKTAPPPSQITAASDRTTIWVPEAESIMVALFGGGDSADEKFKETTYAELELERVSQVTQQITLGGIVVIVLSYAIGMFPLVYSLISGALMLYDDAVIRKWFLGNVRPGEKLYEESLTCPVTTSAPETTSPAAAISESPGEGEVPDAQLASADLPMAATGPPALRRRLVP